MTPEQIRQIVREELENFIFTDRYVFGKNVQFLDGRNIQLAKGTGTKIGTGIAQKMGFFGVTPVAQQAGIAIVEGGGSSFTDAIDITGREAIATIKTALENLGFVEISS